MQITLKDGDVLHNGEKIGIYFAETNTVQSKEPICSVVKGGINTFLGNKAIYVVDGKGIETEEVEVSTIAKNAPPEPEMTKQFGDRTPEWAEWCRTYDPKRFKKHFNDIRPFDLNTSDDHED